MFAKTIYTGGDIRDYILDVRGVEDPFERGIMLTQSERILPSSLVGNTDPLKEMIHKARKIWIHGDYDADGICSTAIAYRYLKKNVSTDIECIIPERSDGYGINIGSLDCISAGELIITVDCGITAKEVSDEAEKRGIMMVVIDHHKAQEGKVPLCPVFGPYHSDEYSTEISGSMVAYKVFGGMYGESDFGLQLATIGTIADVMPMTGENRPLVRSGLESVRQFAIPPIDALSRKMRVFLKAITEEDIAWSLSPAINSAGRMGNVKVALDLMLSDDPEESRGLAAELVSMNEDRKNITKDIHSEVKVIEALSPNVNIAILEDVGEGLVGLVSGRLSDDDTAAVVINVKNGEISASCRGPEWFNCHEMVQYCKEGLYSGGGHVGAAGMTIVPDKMEFVIEKIAEYANTKTRPLVDDFTADIEIYISDITKNISRVESLRPYGRGFEKPLFLSRAIPTNVRATKTGIHTMMELDGVSAIAFNVLPSVFVEGETCTVVYEASMSNFMGKSQVKLMVRRVL